MGEEIDVYQDKIEFAKTLLWKELDISDQFNFLHRNIRLGTYEQKHINRYVEYSNCWQNIMMLADIIGDDYMPLLKKEKKLLHDRFLIIRMKYKEPKDNLTYDDLQTASEAIHKLMQLSGFHNVIRKKEYNSGVDKVYKRYKLNKDSGKVDDDG